MAVILPIAPVGAEASMALARPASPQAPGGASFADMITSGLASVDASVAKADALVASFAAGESVPVHEVTLALEQARLSVELAAQVRSRLIEAYRDFMNLQL